MILMIWYYDMYIYDWDTLKFTCSNFEIIVVSKLLQVNYRVSVPNRICTYHTIS